MRHALALAALMLAAGAAPAQERDPYSGAPLPPAKHAVPSPISDHFYIRAALFDPQVRTRLRVDPSAAAAGVTGTPLNAEHDLGLPGHLHQGYLEFMFRLRERNKVRVSYYQSERSGGAVLANSIVFGNQSFAAGQVTSATLNLRRFDITYTYSLLRTEHFELGTGLGLYFLQVDAIGAVPAQNKSQEVTAATPFPALPLEGTWRISSRWAASLHAAYLRANLSGYRGWYADPHEELQYRWNPSLVLGLGYSSIRTSLTRRGGSFPGAFALSISGPEAFVRFSF
jgi:hypothetical protein